MPDLYSRYIPDENGGFRRTVVDEAPAGAYPPEPAPRQSVPALLSGPADPGEGLLLAVFLFLLAACGAEERPAILAAAAVYFLT